MSCIRTKYGDFLRKSLYSVRIQENRDQKKLRIWALFTQRLFVKKNNSIDKQQSQKLNEGVNKKNNNVNMKLLWNKEISTYVQVFSFPKSYFCYTASLNLLNQLKLFVSWNFRILFDDKTFNILRSLTLSTLKKLGGVPQTHLPIHHPNLKILKCYEVEICTSNAPW